MNDMVELWIYLSEMPLFGLTATLAAYLFGFFLYARSGYASWANPVLTSVAILIALLLLTGTPYPRYFSGAQFIHFLLGPAVVALAWPLWQRRQVVRRYFKALLTAALIGGAVSALSAVLLGWAFGLPRELIVSMSPKAMTAPVAMGVAEAIHGLPALAAIFVLYTGLFGAITAKYLFDWCKIDSWPVRGFALGTQAHGFGTARALQINAEAGAFAGLALGMQAILGSFLIPLVFRLFQ